MSFFDRPDADPRGLRRSDRPPYTGFLDDPAAVLSTRAIC